ncbi:MAG: hypothetical protein K9J30_12085 [Bacteroidales bacterium]|nr:hypothetical protein [Bacteroidales bacterium]
MKNFTNILFLAILATITTNLFSQDQVVIANYMKVYQEVEEEYLELEQEWKAIHQKTIEEGIKTGWQLWRKLYTGTGDEYNYITLEWYEDFEATITPYPEELMLELYSDLEADRMIQKTREVRDLVRTQVSHRILEAENGKGANYIVINRMHVDEANVNDYVALEDEIWRPYHEVCIEARFRSHWALWREWPFKEGQSIFSTIDGFETADQIMSGEDLLSKVHPDMTWDEIDAKAEKLRRIASVEIWELVDAVFPE